MADFIQGSLDLGAGKKIIFGDGTEQSSAVTDYYTTGEVDTISGALNTDIDTNTSDISTLDTKIDTTSGTLQSQVDSNDSDISDLDTKIDTTSGTLQGEIDGLSNNHSDLDELDYASASHTGFASTAALTTTSGVLNDKIINSAGTAITYYLHEELVPEPADHETLSPVPSDDAEHYDSVTIETASGETELDHYITISGTPSATEIAPGTWTMILWASIDNTNLGPHYINANWYVHEAGETHRPLFTQTAQIDSTDPTRYVIETSVSGIAMDVEDRLEVIMTAQVTGTSRTIGYYIEGIDHSTRFNTPVYANLITDHSGLAGLAYADAGHTGFQPTGDYATNTALSTLDTKVDTTSGTLQGQIDTNTGDISDNTTLIGTTSGTLQSQVSQNASDISDNTTLISTNTSDIATVSGSIVTEHSGLSELDYASAGHTGFQPTGDYATNTDLATVSGLVDTNTSDISTNASDIGDNTTLIGTTSGTLQADIDSNTGDISTLDTKIDTTSGTLQDGIDTNAGNIVTDHSDLDELDYASAGHSGFQIAGDYATDADLATVSGLVDTNTSDIGDNTSDIGDLDTNKADKSNVLELDNVDAFTPDEDYEPATKKYVDDATPPTPDKIEEGNSSVEVIDAGTGYVSTTIDGNENIRTSDGLTIVGDPGVFSDTNFSDSNFKIIGDDTETQLTIATFGRVGDGPTLNLVQTDGDYTTPERSLGDAGSIKWHAYDGTKFIETAAIKVEVSSVEVDTVPSKINIYTTAGDNLALAIEIDRDQNVEVFGNFTVRDDLQVGGTFVLDNIPFNSTDNSGITTTMTAGEDIDRRDLVCIEANTGVIIKADANSATTTPAIGIATENIDDGNPGEILLHGFAEADSKSWNWNEGAVLYASTSTGNMTETKPSGSGDQVQAVAVATGSYLIYFKPSLTVIEIP